MLQISGRLVVSVMMMMMTMMMKLTFVITGEGRRGARLELTSHIFRGWRVTRPSQQSVSGLVCYHLQSPDQPPGLPLVPASHTASPLVEAGC